MGRALGDRRYIW